MTKLSPIESEFETSEQAEAHDLWFRSKIAASLRDARPNTPHAVLMAELDAVIDDAERHQDR